MIDTQQYQMPNVPYHSPMTDYGGAIQEMTDPEDELYKIELTLRNIILDKDGNPLEAGRPLVNDIGISNILGSIFGIVNQVTIMSNLKKEDLPMLMEGFYDTLVRDLMQNRIEWDLKDSTARSRIVNICCNSVWICMRRSYEEGDRRFWKGSQVEHRTTVMNDNQGKGLFGIKWGGSK